MKLDPTLAWLSDPSPFADESRVSEQARFDRQHVEARHVAAWIATIEN
jgi:hypothetical protein